MKGTIAMIRKPILVAPLLASALALALSACVNIGTKVPGTLMSLTPESAPAAGAGASGNLAGATAVLEPAAEARLAVLRIPVQIDDSNVAYLKGTQWVERPTRLFQRLLAETLRAKGGRLVVENDLGVSGPRLSGRLLDMGYDARSRRVIVRFDAVKELPGGKIETKRFEQDVPGVAPEASEVGPALNKAANAVAKDVVDWFG